MEFTYLFLWYIAFFFAGIIGLPISSIFFKNFRDKGYGFAKIIGLVMVGLPLWFLSSIKLVPFTNFTVTIFFIFALFTSIFFLRRSKFKFNKVMIVEETIFLAIFTFWSFIRIFNPRIEGTEKMMNLAFLNSINRTEFFPPQDMWFAGKTINYYYLGHYFYVFISKLTAVPIFFAYNLALSTVISLFFTSLISLFLSFFRFAKGWINFGIALLGASFISFGGNLHFFVKGIAAILSNEKFIYYFPDSTRIIPFTINEYPGYSIVLGDLHGHFLSLPFFILCLALLFVGFGIKINSTKRVIFNMAISLFVVLLYAVNSWDLITIVFLFSAVHLFQLFVSNLGIKKKILTFVKLEISLLIPGLILMVPYLLNFRAPIGGIGFVPFDIKSPLAPWLMMWGAFLICAVIYFAALAKKYIHLEKKLVTLPVILLICATLIIIGVEFVFVRDIFVETNFSYFRTNSVFKFYYHAWVILGIACTFFVYQLVVLFKRNLWGTKWVSVSIIAFLYFVSIIYIIRGIVDFFPVQSTVPQTLDGINFIKREHEGDYYAIRYINEEIKGQPVILEAVGEAYTYFARVSTNTGLPTVIGWPTHEWQWRNDSKSAFARKDEVKAIYEAKDAITQRELLKKYKVEYIYFGELERQVYPNTNKEILLSNGTIIYEYLNTTIYKVIN